MAMIAAYISLHHFFSSGAFIYDFVARCVVHRPVV